MDRFLASADKAKRDQSIEITREMTRVRARLHQLRNNKVCSGREILFGSADVSAIAYPYDSHSHT